MRSSPKKASKAGAAERVAAKRRQSRACFRLSQPHGLMVMMQKRIQKRVW